MKSVTIVLEDDTFIEFYSMAASYLSMTDAECPTTDLMKAIQAACIPHLSEDEKDAVTAQVDKTREMLTQDSPDIYLIKAGMQGIVEKLREEDE